jgi:hypothetical protein
MPQSTPLGRPYLGPPPPLPSIPGIDTELADYLRRFALWCAGNFGVTVRTNSAVAHFLMQSTTGDTVWRITIDDSGVLHQTQLTPGAPP